MEIRVELLRRKKNPPSRRKEKKKKFGVTVVAAADWRIVGRRRRRKNVCPNRRTQLLTDQRQIVRTWAEERKKVMKFRRWFRSDVLNEWKLNCLPEYFHCSKELLNVRADIDALNQSINQCSSDDDGPCRVIDYLSKSCEGWPRRSWLSIIDLKEKMSDSMEIASIVFPRSIGRWSNDNVNLLLI